MNGKYVIKIGGYYLSGRNEGCNSVDLFLEKDLRDAELFGLEEALCLKGSYGGEIVKINLELEELE